MSDFFYYKNSKIRLKNKDYLVEKLLYSDKLVEHYKVSLTDINSECFLLKLFRFHGDYTRELDALNDLQESEFVLKKVTNQAIDEISKNYIILYIYPINYTFESYLESNTLLENQFKKLCFNLIRALILIHSKKITHCNITLKSIFVNSNDQFFLGDFHKSIQLKNVKLNEYNSLLYYKNDIKQLGEFIKEVVFKLSPGAKLKYEDTEKPSFEITKSKVGYNWKYIIKRMTQQNPVLQSDLTEVLLFFSIGNEKFQKTSRVLYNKNLDYIELNEIESLAGKIFNCQEETLDFLLLQKLLFVLELEIENINILARYLNTKIQYEKNFHCSMKIVLVILLLITSKNRVLYRKEKSLEKLNEFWEQFVQHYYQYNYLDYSEVVLKLIQVIEYKKFNLIYTETPWSLFQSYLKRLHEAILIIEQNLPILKSFSNIFLAVIRNELDASHSSFKKYKISLEKTSDELAEIERES